MSEDRKLVVASRVAGLPEPRRSDAEKRPCSSCAAEVWVESTSRRLLSEGFELLCVECAQGQVDPERMDWHPQTSAKVALGDIPPALAQFYGLKEPE